MDDQFLLKPADFNLKRKANKNKSRIYGKRDLLNFEKDNTPMFQKISKRSVRLLSMSPVLNDVEMITSFTDAKDSIIVIVTSNKLLKYSLYFE